MESFIQDYITSNNFELDDVHDEVLLERRISPYATLRPGDLSSLIKLHTSVPAQLKHNRTHGISHHDIEAIIEKEELGLSSGDSDDEKSEEDNIEVVCRAAEQGHVPAEYRVKGIKPHEMPVIGVYVDKNICPGFRYRVRRSGNSKFFWDGQARTLESIGMGYGRRLTFSGDQLNNNECFFWSDSDPSGYAFSIQAVDVGQKFVIQDAEGNVLGEGIIEKIHEPQKEMSMNSGKHGVTKRVGVAMTCRVTYYHRHHHGLMELMAHEIEETISGEAVLTKSRRSRKANLEVIDNIYLPRLGHCKFVPDC